MAKNVIVVDEQGKQYGVTYPKRARGLVKNGRARYLNETTICLACPPNPYLEDIFMSEYIAPNCEATMEEADVGNTGMNSRDSVQFDLSYVLQQLERITKDTDYIRDALARFDGVIDGAMGVGIGNLVQAREQTNRRLIDLYEKMYDDLCGNKTATSASNKTLLQDSLDKIIDAIGACDESDEEKLSVLRDAMENVIDAM